MNHCKWEVAARRPLLPSQEPGPQVINALPLSDRRRRWRATFRASEACCSKEQRRNWRTTVPRGRFLQQ